MVSEGKGFSEIVFNAHYVLQHSQEHLDARAFSIADIVDISSPLKASEAVFKGTAKVKGSTQICGVKTGLETNLS